MSETVSYVALAKIDEIGQASSLKVTRDKHDYLIIRYQDATYVIDDKCPHMGASLSKGTLDDHYIQCPLHKAKFDFINGNVIEDAKIAFFKMKVKAIKTYETVTKNGEIFVKIG